MRSGLRLIGLDFVKLPLTENKFELECLEPRLLLSGEPLGAASMAAPIQCSISTPAAYEVFVSSNPLAGSYRADNTASRFSTSDNGNSGLFDGLQASNLEGFTPGQLPETVSPAPAAQPEKTVPTTPATTLKKEMVPSEDSSVISHAADEFGSDGGSALSVDSQTLGSPTVDAMIASLKTPNGPPAALGVDLSISVFISDSSVTFTGSDKSDLLFLRVSGNQLFFSQTGEQGTFVPATMGKSSFVITSKSIINVNLLGGDDQLLLDSSLISVLEEKGASLQFDGGTGSNALAGSSLDSVWDVTAADEGYLGKTVGFRSVGNLVGGANNVDTFVLGESGSIDGLIDGGLGGFDSLVIDGQHGSVASLPYGPNSGIIRLGGEQNVIRYDGLEPITLSGTATDVIVGGSSGDDQLVLEVDPGDAAKLRVRSTNGTIESVSFVKPTGSLTVSGGSGADTITLPAGQVINLAGADISLTAETLTLTSATLQGRNMNLTAAASSAGSLTNTGLTNVTPAAAATINIGGSAVINASGNLTLSASSSANQSATATALTVGLINTDAAVARAVVNSAAQIHIFGTADLTVTGTLSLTATNLVNVQVTANGTAGGASAAGGSVAFADVTATTSAIIDGSATANANTISVLATSDATVASTALSTRQGATTNPTTQQLLGQFNPAASNGAITVAAALAISRLSSSTTAKLGSAGLIHANSGVTVAAQPFASSDAKADARGVNSLTGVGAGVALNIVSADATASVDGQLQATGLTIRAGAMPAPHLQSERNTFSAEAYSGAGSSGVGVAGAFAQNTVTSNANRALLDGSSQAAIGGTVMLDAGNRSNNQVTADGLGAGSLGIGATIALNVASDAAEAAVRNGAALTGAGSLTLTAKGDHAMISTAKAGAAGGTPTAAAVSLSIPSGSTVAQVGTGAALSVGALSLDANRTNTLTTNSDGKVTGPGVGVGAVFGLSIDNESSLASVGRSVTVTGAATLGSTMNASTDTNAYASAQGAANGSPAVNSLISQWRQLINNNTWTPQPITVPIAGTPSGSLGVAGALALNIAGSSATSTIASGATLQAGTTLSVLATTTYEATALADATAVNSATGIAAAAAINASSPAATANIDAAASAVQVNLVSSASGSTTVTANSGAGATNVGVAGAFAMNLASAKSIASVGAGANVQATSPTGDLMVHATGHATNDHALADGTAPGFAGTGVGASVVFNILTNTTDASVAGQASSGRKSTILAEGDYTTHSEAEGGATGGTSIAPAMDLTVSANLTRALVVSTAIMTVGSDLLVRASHQGSTPQFFQGLRHRRANSSGCGVGPGHRGGSGAGSGCGQSCRQRPRHGGGPGTEHERV
jgi:hypothetical protein